MKFTYTPERLTLTCDESERAILREMITDGGSFNEAVEADFMESLLCNSELDWTSAEETEDLTDAPMLCILGNTDVPENELSAHENVNWWRGCGCWQGETFYNAILHRWAYPHYQLRSFLTDLMDKGEAIFLSNW